MDYINNISVDDVKTIISDTEYYKNTDTRLNIFNKLIFGLVFYEPSTRTCLSFESAIYRLGGKCIKYNNIVSSERKGESFIDTIKMIENYVDVIIIRHPDANIIDLLHNTIKKPFINAGNGADEHPTQALIDYYTITESYAKLPASIAFIGDIKYSRTIHSLVYLLSRLSNITFYFVCDTELQPSGKFKQFLDTISNKYVVIDDITDIISKIDILYITRLQNERYTVSQTENYIVPTISKKIIQSSKKSLIILHPLPRNNELNTDLDNNSKSKYFQQANNGVYVRMAILKYICYKYYKNMMCYD